MKDTLVVYFAGSDKSVVKKAATAAASLLGADTFEIVCENPYSTDRKVLVAQALKDKENDARPAIKGELPELDAYSNVVLLFPNWCGTAPMPVFTFLDAEADALAGKEIHVFAVNDGGGLQDIETDLHDHYPQAIFEQIEAVHADNADETIVEILKEEM